MQILASQTFRLLQSARHAETSVVVLVVGLVVVAYLTTYAIKLTFVVGKNQKIIDISHVAQHSRSILDEMVQRIEKDIRKELTCLIANRNPVSTFYWRK